METKCARMARAGGDEPGRYGCGGLVGAGGRSCEILKNYCFMYVYLCGLRNL